ncbi:hypothetical protein ACWGRF_02060 [Streptomyces zhihengii]
MPSAFVSKLARQGARNPEALAAWIGRKKLGKAAFTKLAAKDNGGGSKPAKSSGNSRADRAESRRQDTAARLNSGGDAGREQMSKEEQRLVSSLAERLAKDPASLRSERSQGHGDESKAKTRTEVLRARAVTQALELRRRRFGET